MHYGCSTAIGVSSTQLRCRQMMHLTRLRCEDGGVCAHSMLVCQVRSCVVYFSRVSLSTVTSFPSSSCTTYFCRANTTMLISTMH
eukprot:41385-Eustigmatos_ZCMA.PRE.1